MNTAETPPAHDATPAAERVHRHLRAAILDGRLAAGDLITEGSVAAEVGVSRTPVREGMLRLEAQGLLRLYPKRGALVLPVTAAEAADVFEARQVIEGFAAAKVWPARAVLLPRLAAVVDDMRTRLAADDASALAAADREFHAVIVRAAGNAVLAKLYDGLRDRQRCMGVARLAEDPDRMAGTVREHAELVEALAGDDEARFRHLTRAHVDRTAQRSSGRAPSP